MDRFKLTVDDQPYELQDGDFLTIWPVIGQIGFIVGEGNDKSHSPIKFGNKDDKMLVWFTVSDSFYFALFIAELLGFRNVEKLGGNEQRRSFRLRK